jgi:hypothetical protein
MRTQVRHGPAMPGSIRLDLRSGRLLALARR